MKYAYGRRGRNKTKNSENLTPIFLYIMNLQVGWHWPLVVPVGCKVTIQTTWEQQLNWKIMETNVMDAGGDDNSMKLSIAHSFVFVVFPARGEAVVAF